MTQKLIRVHHNRNDEITSFMFFDGQSMITYPFSVEKAEEVDRLIRLADERGGVISMKSVDTYNTGVHFFIDFIAFFDF